MFNPQFLAKIYSGLPPCTLEELAEVPKHLDLVCSNFSNLTPKNSFSFVEFRDALTQPDCSDPKNCDVLLGKSLSQEMLPLIFYLKRLAQDLIDRELSVEIQRRIPSGLVRISDELAEDYPSSDLDSDGNRYVSLEQFINEHDSNGHIYALSTFIHTLDKCLERVKAKEVAVSFFINNMIGVAECIFDFLERAELFLFVGQAEAKNSNGTSAGNTHLMVDLLTGKLPPLASSRAQLAFQMFSQMRHMNDADDMLSNAECYCTILQSSLLAIENLPLMLAEALSKICAQPNHSSESSNASSLQRRLTDVNFLQTWQDGIARKKFTPKDLECLKQC